MFLLLKRTDRKSMRQLSGDFRSAMTAGSVHFSQQNLGVSGTFPYRFPCPVCCEQFLKHDFVTRYYKIRK